MNDSVMAFCDDCVDPVLDKVLTKQDFYTSYKMWCENQGLRPVSQTKLKPSLLQVFPYVKDGRDGAYGPRVWFGIELNDDAPKPYGYNAPRYDLID
jgi:phage/plasmid-associated DNA primase